MLLSGFLNFSKSSEHIITPKVANAESQSERSNIEYGLITQISVTAMSRLVIESFDFEKKNISAEIIYITPALTTETGNPIRDI